MIALDELEKNARAALGPHRWSVYRCDRAKNDEACGIKSDPAKLGIIRDTSYDECHHHMDAVVAEHIAASDPAAVLELIARIEEDRRDIARMKPVVEAAQRWRAHRHYTFSNIKYGDELECSLETLDSTMLAAAAHAIDALENIGEQAAAIILNFQRAYIGETNPDRDPATVEPEDIRRLRIDWEEQNGKLAALANELDNALAKVTRAHELLVSARTQADHAQAEVLRMRPVVEAAERWMSVQSEPEHSYKDEDMADQNLANCALTYRATKVTP